MQKQMGVDQPNFGCLLESAIVKSELSMDELIKDNVEAALRGPLPSDVIDEAKKRLALAGSRSE